MSKIYCIYHSIDLDGWMSAAIVKHWWNETESIKSDAIHTLEFIGYNYGQPIPDLSEYDKVIMCDISFPAKEFLKLYNQVNTNITVIDHHISTINELQELIDTDNIDRSLNGLRDTNYAACELTWKYFFPNETMPEIVRLLGRYDCFGHKGTDEEQKILEFQYGARQVITNYEEAHTYLMTNLDESDISPIDGTSYVIDMVWDKGKSIYQYLCIEAKQVYKNGFTITFKSTPIDNTSGIALYKFICINKERFNPINFGIDYHKDGYDGCACFHYADGMWNFSLCNDNGEVDCSIIAKQFGGDGYKGAAGFRLTKEEFNNLILK